MNNPQQPEGWSSLGAKWRSNHGAAERLQAVDIQQVRARAAQFASKIRRRNAIELFACLFVAVVALRMTLFEERRLLIASGVALLVGVFIVTATILLRARSTLAPQLQAPTREFLQHERRELERQAHLLENVWLWYLAPLLPGVVLSISDEVLVAVEHQDQGALALSVVSLVAAISFFFLVGLHNRRAAVQLRARVEGSALPLREPPDTIHQ